MAQAMDKVWARRCSAAIALLVALSAFADVSVPASAPNAARVIILTAKQARACSGDHKRYVTPLASDVQRIESSLERGLAGFTGNDANGFMRHGAAKVLARRGKDIRFYVGTADGFIHVQGYCADIIERTSRTCPPDIDDGGSCVWYIRFDVKHGTFDQFGTNGDG